MSFKCIDCGIDTLRLGEYPYTVHDGLWSQAKMRPDGGMLCVGCLETRIGRRLCSADFDGASHARVRYESQERDLAQLLALTGTPESVLRNRMFGIFRMQSQRLRDRLGPLAKPAELCT